MMQRNKLSRKVTHVRKQERFPVFKWDHFGDDQQKEIEGKNCFEDSFVPTGKNIPAVQSLVNISDTNTKRSSEQSSLFQRLHQKYKQEILEFTSEYEA